MLRGIYKVGFIINKHPEIAHPEKNRGRRNTIHTKPIGLITNPRVFYHDMLTETLHQTSGKKQ